MQIGSSFDDFYAANFGRLAAHLYAYVGDLAEAQDIAQEAFYRAWLRWNKLVRYDDPFAWTRRVAWNEATSRWRRWKTATDFNRRQTVEHAAGPTPDRVALIRALGQIPAKQRLVLVLHYLSGLSVAEIAEQLGCSDGTVRSWLHRGRGALANQLADVSTPDPARRDR